MKTWWLVLMSRSSSDSATTGFGNSGYQSGGVAVGGRDQRPAGLGPFGDELVEVVGLRCRVLAHREVVEDQDVGSGEFGEAFGPGAVGVAAGEVGQCSAGLVEADLGALPDGQVPEGLCDMGFPDADGPWRRTDSPLWSKRRAARSRSPNNPSAGCVLGAPRRRQRRALRDLQLQDLAVPSVP